MFECCSKESIVIEGLHIMKKCHNCGNCVSYKNRQVGHLKFRESAIVYFFVALELIVVYIILLLFLYAAGRPNVYQLDKIPPTLIRWRDNPSHR